MIVLPTLGEAVVNVTADVSEVESGMETAKDATEDFADNAEDNMANVQDAIDGVADSAKSLAKIGGITFGGLAGAIITSLRATTDHEDALTRLESVLGDVERAADLEDYADQLQDISRFSNEAVMEGMVLLGMYDMQNDQIKALTRQAMDFAEVTGRDMQTAVRAMVRAMDGSTGLLSRYGIVMDETQKEILQTGNEQERINVLLDVFEKHTGPAANRMAGTLSGAWRRMRNEIDDLLKVIGRLFDDDTIIAL